jgi:hypothetical protein
MALTDKASQRLDDAQPEGGVGKPASNGLADLPRSLAEVRMARHITSDALHPAELLAGELEARLRASHQMQLAGKDLEGRLEWALERILRLETRLLGLQAAMAGHAPPGLAHDVAPRQSVPPASPPPSAPSPAPQAAAQATAGGGLAGKPEPAAAPARQAVRALALRFDAELRCMGLYDTETRAGRPPLRWVGPATKAEIWLPRLEAPLELRFAVAGVFVADVLKEIRFSVDGGEWTKPDIQEVDGVRLLRLRPVPGQAGPGETMHVAIDTVLQDSPVNRGGTDKRKLSIAFSRVEVRCL